MNSLSDIARCIADRDNFVLTGHTNPDGDCIGSLLALWLGLRIMGKQADVLLQDPVPEIYRYLEGAEQILSIESIHEWQNVIFLDCSDAERAGDKVLNIIGNIPFHVCIDHHASNEAFADFNYIDSKAAATAEIIFDLLNLLSVHINEPIANALYVGIVQDTGNFKHSSTTSKTFRIAAELIERGASVVAAKTHLFESKNKKEVQFLVKALASLTFSEDDRVAWMTITQQDSKQLGFEDLNPEGVINYTLMTKGVEVGLFFRELDDQIVKVGFRSKGEVNVAELAEKFGGGGHRQASGASLNKPLDEVEKMVMRALKEVM